MIDLRCNTFKFLCTTTVIGFVLMTGLLLSPARLIAQTVAVSEEMTMLKNVDYDIMGKFGDLLLMARIYESELDIQAFDDRLYGAWNRPIKFKSKKSYVLNVVPQQDRFSVFYTDITKDSVHLMVKQYDPNVKMIDSLRIKSYYKDTPPDRFKITNSEDKSKVAIHHMKPESQLEVLYFNLEELRLEADHLYDMIEFDFRKNFKNIFLANNGELFIVLDNTYYVSSIKDQVVSVIKSGVNQLAPMVAEGVITTVAVSSLTYTFDNYNHQLIGVGLFGTRVGSETMGALRIKFPGNFINTPTISYVAYDPQLLQDFKAGRKLKNESIPNLIIQDVILRVDGGVILLAEERKEYERSLYQGRRDFYSMRFAIDYYYEDLILIAIHPDGSSHWQKLLQKKQYSFDDDALYSSFFVFKNRSSIRLLYNDEIKNENTVSEYILTGGGKHERRSVLSTNRQDLKLQIRNSLQISPEEVVIPSIKRNKLKLVKVNYAEMQ
jgi:hypothetical protein